MDAKQLIDMQRQMRENQQDMQDFVKGLDQWETDVKRKDSTLKSSKASDLDKKNLPPVRNSLHKKKFQKKKPTTDKTSKSSATYKKISGFDFRAWDKFDVDKACKEIDDKDDTKSSSEYETDEEWEETRKKQQANVEKDNGNRFFKDGQYDNAIACYTTGMQCDPTNAILPANRAMSLLKQNKHAAAEVDCTTALTLDPTYIKAYSRRGTARLGLAKLPEARQDFQQVLKLEPKNKQAQIEIENIDRKLDVPDTDKTSTTVGIVKPVYKPTKERSKKPLQRIEIEEIGDDDDSERKDAIGQILANQSQARKDIEQQDGQLFDKFVKNENFSIESGENKSIVPTLDIKEICVNGTATVSSVNVPSPRPSPRQPSGQGSQSPRSSPRQPSGQGSQSPRSFDVPHTSYQFQSDWKILKHNDEEFFNYIRKINPSIYPKLFGEMLDSDILLKMLTVFKKFYIRDNLNITLPLQHLSKVKRFDMVSMFLSDAEKQVVKDLMTVIKTQAKLSETELNKLFKLYSL